jgi:hypothetical protein
MREMKAQDLADGWCEPSAASGAQSGASGSGS